MIAGRPILQPQWVLDNLDEIGRRLGEQLLERRTDAFAHRALEPRVVRRRAIPRRRDEQLVGAVCGDLELGGDEARHRARLTQDLEPRIERHDVVAPAASCAQDKNASDHGGGL